MTLTNTLTRFHLLNLLSASTKEFYEQAEDFQTSKFSNFFICLMGNIFKSSEKYYFTVYKCQQTEIALVFVSTSIFTFSYTTVIK